MTIVYAAYAPNAPFLIAPAEFGGVGTEANRALDGLRVIERFRPDTIVVSSPHWVTDPVFRVHAGARPRQLYDFSGFPPALSRVRYEPPGDAELAGRLAEAGRRAGLAAETTEDWGLDHGAWAPLLHFASGASVPVVPISILRRNPSLHLRWGRAMRTILEEEGRRVVFLATGSIVHNFGRFDPDPRASWPEAEAVEREMVERILARDSTALGAFDARKTPRKSAAL